MATEPDRRQSPQPGKVRVMVTVYRPWKLLSLKSPSQVYWVPPPGIDKAGGVELVTIGELVFAVFAGL